jgi:RNA polymerase-binding transcription factor DksA
MPAKKIITKASGPVIKKVKINPKFEVYRKLLLKTRDQISGDIRHLSDDNNGSGNDRGGDVSGHALHMADVATDMYDREFALGLAANDRELLTRINQAIVRIEDGTYGVCATCKKTHRFNSFEGLAIHSKLFEVPRED